MSINHCRSPERQFGVRGTMSEKLPGRGFFGWLGRQFGYVSKAVKRDVGVKKIYRNAAIQEKQLPNDPNVTLRRTTIDEVIVTKDGTGRPAHSRPD